MRSRSRAILAGASAAAALMLAGCGAGTPPDPYDHEPVGEVSVARPVGLDGSGGGSDSGIVIDGLARAGFFCVDARRNEAAAQLWCRRRTARATAVVDIVATRDGDIHHARIAIEETSATTRTRADSLREVLSVSLLRAWPGDEETVIDAIQEAEQAAADRRDEALLTTGEHRETDLSDGRTLSLAETSTTATVTAERDGAWRWPYGAGHYATSLGATRAGLTRAGFRCDPSVAGYTRCARARANQEVRLTSHDDQVTSVAFGVGSIVAADGSTTPLGDHGFPNGLPFLTAEVEPAVRARIERFRATGRRFMGVVAGTVLVVDGQDPVPPTRQGFATYGEVVIGVPLIETK